MTWVVTSQMDEALRSRIIRPAILFALDHSAAYGWCRLWSGIGNVTWNGDIYYGAGVLLSASPAEETTELQIARVTFQLAAPDFSDEALAIITTPVRRRPFFSWKALLDEKMNVIPEPRLRFQGYADSPSVSDDENGKRVVTLNVEGALHNLTAPLQRQVSHEEQQALFPGDTGLSLMSSIQNQQLVWDTGSYNGFAPP